MKQVASPSSGLQEGFLSNLRYDLPAGLVVFLVALPLCLGIALASGAPLFSGVITGVIAGVLVGFLSGSNLSVSGPAAGLTTIVASAIVTLGSFEAFLCAVFLSGIFQILFGALRAGPLAGLFPTSVIKGMLVAIGLTIFLKQIPHALGGKADFHDEMGFYSLTSQDNAVGEISRALVSVSPSAALISFLSLALLLFWNSPAAKKIKLTAYLPGPLATVILGAVLNQIFHLHFPGLALTAQDGHLVELPSIASAGDLLKELSFPLFSALWSKTVWVTAFTIAVVGSLETLLCIESTDKMDPFRRISDNNRELFAQGIGNVLCGLVGGLPMTSVIVRSSANIYAGGRTRMSSVFHGAILLACVLLIPGLLNLIPLASLASVLLVVGYKLAHPDVFKRMFRLGADQFLPFIITVFAILFTDLLSGVLVGLVAGIGTVLKASYYSAITVAEGSTHTLIRFTKDVTFVHKLRLKKALRGINGGTKVIFDGTRVMFIDYDIYELIEDFQQTAPLRNIEIELRGMENKRFALFGPNVKE